MTSPDGYGRGSIITPEAVLLDFELAGVGSRSVAFGIDFAVQVMALFAFFAVTGLVATGSELLAIIFLLFGLISIVLGYPVIMETMNSGRTLGRMAVGTRVVTVEGAPVRFRQSFIRSLLGIVDLFLTAGALATAAALMTRRGQRVGDLVAGTMVIRERSAAGQGSALHFWAPRYLAQWATTVDTRGLGNDGYQIVRDFLSRPDLSDKAQNALGLEIADYVSERLPHAARTAQVPPRDYLMAIAAAAQTPEPGRTAPPPPRPTGPPLSRMPPPPALRQSTQGAGFEPPAVQLPAPTQPAPSNSPYEPPTPFQPFNPADVPAPAAGQPAPPAAPAPQTPPPNDGGFSTPG